MKIKIDIDITPEELRRFLGLPDMSALQEDLMRYAREQIGQGAEGFDPAAFLRDTTIGSTKAWQRIMSAAFNKASEAAQAYSAAAERGEDSGKDEDAAGERRKTPTRGRRQGGKSQD